MNFFSDVFRNEEKTNKKHQLWWNCLPYYVVTALCCSAVSLLHQYLITCKQYKSTSLSPLKGGWVQTHLEMPPKPIHDSWETSLLLRHVYFWLWKFSCRVSPRGGAFLTKTLTCVDFLHKTSWYRSKRRSKIGSTSIFQLLFAGWLFFADFCLICDYDQHSAG